LIAGRFDCVGAAGQEGLKDRSVQVAGLGEIDLEIGRCNEKVEQRVCVLDRAVAAEHDAILVNL
jgi:hypothetical protein